MKRIISMLLACILMLQAVPLGTHAAESYDIQSFEELKELAVETGDSETSVYYEGDNDLVISQNLTLPENMSLYATEAVITVPKGITFRAGEITSVKSLVVKGTAYLNYTRIDASMTVTGKVYANGGIEVEDVSPDKDPDEIIIGGDKITFSNYGRVMFRPLVYTMAELKSCISKAKALTNPKYEYVVFLRDDFVIDQSVTVPEKCCLTAASADSVTVAKDCTLTINGEYAAYHPLTVEGKLVNNSLLEIEHWENDFYDGTLTIASGGSYSGRGSIRIYGGMHHRDVITGVDWDDFTITGYSNYTEVRYVGGLTRQAKPTSLKWGKLEDFWAYDESAGEYRQKDITLPGAIAFKPGDTKAKTFNICLYNSSDTIVHSWTSRWDEVPEWCFWLEFLFGDYPSDSYYFTVTAAGDYVKTRDSETAKSKVFEYKKPSKKLGACTDVSWKQNGFPSFDNSGSSYLLGYQLELYYSSTKSGTPMLIDRPWYITQYATKDNIFDRQILERWHLEEYGPGYYFYKVRALSNDINTRAHGAWSGMSNGIYMEPLKLKESNVASSGKPKISWNALKDAEEYEVYRATSKNGTFKKVKTTTSKSYTDKEAKAGKVYYYMVRGVTSKGVKMPFSEVISRACDLPQPTVKVSNVASSGKIKISWAEISGAEKYEVYRATSKDGEYTRLTTVTGTSVTNTSAKAGKTYYYKVKAIHSNSSANSAYSSVVSRTCDLARPDVEVSLNSSGKPRLKWASVDGAVEYKVYRATSKDGTYSLLKTTTGTSLTNTSAKKGKTYYYKVKAIHSKSAANSAYSSVDSIKAK